MPDQELVWEVVSHMRRRRLRQVLILLTDSVCLEIENYLVGKFAGRV